jgi:hypothetical protein
LGTAAAGLVIGVIRYVRLPPIKAGIVYDTRIVNRFPAKALAVSPRVAP